MFRASSDRIVKAMSTKVCLEILSAKDVSTKARVTCIWAQDALERCYSPPAHKDAEEERKEEAEREAHSKSGHGQDA